jgi:ribosomal protein S18 acetylase RimI-like enzyme
MINKVILPDHLKLRQVSIDDQPLLLRWFCSARPELNSLPLPAAQLTLLLQQQFQLQQRGYAEQFPAAEHWIVEGCSVGAESHQTGGNSLALAKVHLQAGESDLHLIDFLVAPEQRGFGVGTAVLSALQTYVRQFNGTLSLSVDRSNQGAKRLYLRMGFNTTGGTDTHEFLCWRSSP